MRGKEDGGNGNFLSATSKTLHMCGVFFLPPQVKLYKSENLDNPVHTVSLGQSLFFHFPPLLRDGEVLLSSFHEKLGFKRNAKAIRFTRVFR